MEKILLNIVLLATFLWPVIGFRPYMEPFFFLCNYHGNNEEAGGIDKGEVALSVSVEGNPEYYTPDQFYNISIKTSLNFDGFLLTGLYSINSDALLRSQSHGVYHRQLSGSNLMCSIVFSHISYQPEHEMRFIWKAPPRGTGCVNFLATATLGQQLLYKDITVLQLCEAGAPTLSPLRPDLASKESQGIVLRDDFDSSPDLDSNIWSSSDGVEVSKKCGTVMYGYSVTFCDQKGSREMAGSTFVHVHCKWKE